MSFSENRFPLFRDMLLTMMESLMNRTTDNQDGGHRDPSSSPGQATLTRDRDDQDQQSDGQQGSDDSTIATLASVAVVGIGAAVFEAALIPGIVIGAAAMWLPSHYAKMGATAEPFLRTAAGGANTLSAAATVFDVASGLGRLGLRGSPRHRAFSALSWGLRAFGGNSSNRRGGPRRR
jgi:hypothetical protein